MNKAKPIEQLIQTRFNDLFLDVKTAQANLANVGKPELSVIELEQSKTDRSLLRVEKQAIREKDLNKKSDLSYMADITSQLNIEVEKRLIEELKDVNYLYSKVVSIDSVMPELLDAVGVKAATISKIEPLVCDMPWFFNDLMKMVNQPKYRRVDSNGKVVLVDSMRLGLSFFGLENLIEVITSLAFKRWLPQITDPYPQIKVRIWEEALATAISCKQIAGISGVNQSHAFCLGMFQMMGKIVISRLYFRLFEAVQREALMEAEEDRKHEEHSALNRIHASGEFLNRLIEKYATPVSSRLIDKMGFKRVIIANAMHEVAENAKEISPLATTLKQGKAYAQYRMLRGHKLIDLQQSKDFIRTLNLPKGALAVLKTTDMRSLSLTFDAD